MNFATRKQKHPLPWFGSYLAVDATMQDQLPLITPATEIPTTKHPQGLFRAFFLLRREDEACCTNIHKASLVQQRTLVVP
jgi:hypothetical protein